MDSYFSSNLIAASTITLAYTSAIDSLWATAKSVSLTQESINSPEHSNKTYNMAFSRDPSEAPTYRTTETAPPQYAAVWDLESQQHTGSSLARPLPSLLGYFRIPEINDFLGSPTRSSTFAHKSARRDGNEQQKIFFETGLETALEQV